MPYATTLQTTMMGPVSPNSLVSPASPWTPRRRPSAQSSWATQRRPSRPWNEAFRHTLEQRDSSNSLYEQPPPREGSVSPRISFETPVWERPIRPLEIPTRRSHSPTANNSVSSTQSAVPRRAVTVAANSYVSPTSPLARPLEGRARQDSSRMTPFEDFEDMSMFAAAMTGLDDGWSCGPPALSVTEPLSPTVLNSPRDASRRHPAHSRQSSTAHLTSQGHRPLSQYSHARPEPSPPLTPNRAPSPAFSFEDQPTSHLEEYPDSNRSFAAAMTGIDDPDQHDVEDELPNYAQSQLEAASAHRRQALLRAAELERRWTASRTKRR